MAEFTSDKMLPQSLEAEQAVLAAMFNDRDAILDGNPATKRIRFLSTRSWCFVCYHA